MKYDVKYPNAKHTDVIREHGLLVADDLKPCRMCNEETKFIDFCIEGRICSEECSDKLNGWLNEHCR